jgi:hypothetical protein
VNFRDADCLAGKDGAEVNLFVSQTDASAIGEYDDLVVEGISGDVQSLVGAGGGLTAQAGQSRVVRWTLGQRAFKQSRKSEQS